jgi:hypothetical protein
MTGAEITEKTMAEVREWLDLTCESEKEDSVDAYVLWDLVRELPAEVLRPLHRRLIEAEVVFPRELYYCLSEDDANYLVSLIDAGVEDSWMWLEVLVMAPTAAATRAFARWRTGAGWMTGDEWPLNYENLAGGWELDAEGNVRVLVNPVAYALTATTDVGASVSGGPLAQRRCFSCGLALWRVLDVDLADPVYAGLGLAHAGRLAAATCLKCGARGTDTVSGEVVIFHEYDAEGRILVDASDEQSGTFSYTDSRHDDWTLPDDPPLLSAGPRPLPPHTAESKLGGAPKWEQEPEYPACPRCDRTMHLLAQIGRSPLFGEGYEGFHYVFADVECRVSAVIYQMD